MRIRLFFCTMMILAILITTEVVAQELYKITTKETGFLSLDYTVTEIKRAERFSVLRIPGFHKRSALASRWMMCVYTDLAQRRGFQYWTVVYPEPPSEDVIVGFPHSENEDIVRTLGPQFGTTKAMPTMPVQKMVLFCNSMQAQ